MDSRRRDLSARGGGGRDRQKGGGGNGGEKAKREIEAGRRVSKVWRDDAGGRTGDQQKLSSSVAPPKRSRHLSRAHEGRSFWFQHCMDSPELPNLRASHRSTRATVRPYVVVLPLTHTAPVSPFYRRAPLITLKLNGGRRKSRSAGRG